MVFLRDLRALRGENWVAAAAPGLSGCSFNEIAPIPPLPRQSSKPKTGFGNAIASKITLDLSCVQYFMDK